MSTNNKAYGRAYSKGLAKIADTVADAVRNAFRLFSAFRGRRAVHGMLALDDRMLSDIGLSRTDVEGALGSPWHDDPSEMLARKQYRRPFFRDAKSAA